MPKIKMIKPSMKKFTFVSIIYIFQNVGYSINYVNVNILIFFRPLHYVTFVNFCAVLNPFHWRSLSARFKIVIKVVLSSSIHHLNRRQSLKTCFNKFSTPNILMWKIPSIGPVGPIISKSKTLSKIRKSWNSKVSGQSK